MITTKKKRTPPELLRYPAIGVTDWWGDASIGVPLNTRRDGQEPKYLFCPSMGAVPPPHSINFQDEQASDKDPSHIPFHRIHPSLNVSIFAAHFSTHRIGNRPFLRPGVDNDDDDYNRQRAFRPGEAPEPSPNGQTTSSDM